MTIQTLIVLALHVSLFLAMLTIGMGSSGTELRRARRLTRATQRWQQNH